MEEAKGKVWVREGLDAYYYSFEPTGDADIDRILGAVAWAGKAFHHTSDWDDDTLGTTCAENIQAAANLAAKNRATPPPCGLAPASSEGDRECR